MQVKLLNSGLVVGMTRVVTMTFYSKGSEPSDRRKYVEGVLKVYGLSRAEPWENNTAEFRRNNPSKNIQAS